MDAVEQYARERGLSLQDARQTFMQVVVLKNLTLPAARLIGGTALVLGHGNPRFSEDIDLTQISNPGLLKPGLSKAARELEGWFEHPVRLTPPRKGGRSWRLSCPFDRATSVQLHVDCQKERAYTTHPIVLKFPSLPSFICEAEALDEIMADKVIAVAFRRYLGGRDLFDLWFHWLRLDDWTVREGAILPLIRKKCKDRAILHENLARHLKERLSPKTSLDRARQEWRRYLPPEFHREGVEHDMLRSAQRLLEMIR